jgi:hypothetical protein
MTLIETLEKRIKTFRADLNRYDQAMPTSSDDLKSKIKIMRDEIFIRLQELEWVMKLLEQHPLEPSPTRRCEICGKPFLSIRDSNIYCSIGCRQKAYRQRKESGQ